MEEIFDLFEKYICYRNKHIESLNLSTLINSYAYSINNNHNIANFNSVINDWNYIYNDMIKKYSQSLEVDLFVKWMELVENDKLRNFEVGHNFNIFEVLNFAGLNVGETSHSRLLKFLLDDNHIHGHGYRFLYLFLNKLGIYKPECGIWLITAEEGRVDVMLKRNSPKSVIIIENKSNWAIDQPNQLYRYWFENIYGITKDEYSLDIEYYSKNTAYYNIIYLVPNNYKALSNQTLAKPDNLESSVLPNKLPIEVKTLSFCDFISDWLDECINIVPENNYPLREYIKQYKFKCQTL